MMRCENSSWTVVFLYLASSWSQVGTNQKAIFTQINLMFHDPTFNPSFEEYLLQKIVQSTERVLFIGTQFSNLYTIVDTPARGNVGVCGVCV
jgi:hypothetical protein